VAKHPRFVAVPRAKRRSFPDALSEQQILDALLYAQPLPRQMLPFAMRSLGILLVRCRHTDHAASFGTARKNRQNAQHTLGVEAVRFGATSPAIDQDAGRFKHKVLYAMPSQNPV
jgi:hypothetical protein